MANSDEKKHILIIEDCKEDFESYKKLFQDQYHVTVCENLMTAKAEIKKKRFDLVLIDLKLPDGNGLTFLLDHSKQFREENTSIFVISGVNNDHAKVNAFECDADEYLTKPLSLSELQARVSAHFRKKANLAGTMQSRRCGNLQIHLESQKVGLQEPDKPEETVSLSQIEYKLLLFFVSNKEQVKSRKQIIDAVWGHDFNVGERTIDTHICYLRKKLKNSEYNVRTILGSGYAFRRID